jgi:DNA invertase Pin-like site-specific DNA recombinase
MSKKWRFKKMAQQPVDLVMKKRIVRMLKDGKSILYTSDSTGISTTTIGKIKREMGLIEKPKVTENAMISKFYKLTGKINSVFN